MEEQGHKTPEFTDPPQPFWLDSSSPTSYEELTTDIKADIAIVGGGLVGITTAYLLRQQGLKVVILEADRILQGTTGHTTAKLTSQHDIIYSELVKNLGQEKAKQYADANEQTIKFVEDLIYKEKIQCDFSGQAAYIFTQSDDYLDKLQQEAEAASSLGLLASLTHHCPLPFPVKAALRFDGQAQFHARKFALGLVERISGEDCPIFENTRVVDVHEGVPCTLITEKGHKVQADNVVVATHFPFYGSNQFYFARLEPSRSYVLGITTRAEFPGGMYLSAETPTHSLRSTPFQAKNEKKDLILIAGEEHRPGEGPDTNLHYRNLLDFARKHYPSVEVHYRWSTQDYTTLDKVPYVGLLNSGISNIYVATGFRKWGMTNGITAARIISDLIVRGENPWAEVYNPSRFEADPMIKNFVTTNFEVAKHLIGDKLSAVPDEGEPAAGEAKVVARNGEKIGLYKDRKGKIHAVDITCTHMGCDLMWNAAELSWDCPCHGSRFTYEGEIIEGPALKSLRTHDNFKFNP
ncbi:MAG TPA: FAD-dependent oxidoreductase [Bacillota bacterium]|nr:FAD-dependent oxidoreductase [Bacillota bacterium]